MNKIKYSILTLSLIFLFSCANKPQSTYFDTIVKSEEGIFRGIEIGNSVEQIKTAENKEFLVDNMSDYLYYDYKLDMGNSYTISYDFSEDKLYEIQLSSYFDAIEDAEKLFADFNNHFTKKYGTGKIENDGYTSWRTKSKNTGNTVEIVMINDSQEYGYISLIISDLNY